MKVLLLYQTDRDKRPVCFHRYKSDPRSGGGRAYQLWSDFWSEWRHNPWCRWWLVECENAEAGRAVIGYASIGGAASSFYSAACKRVVTGRILTQGGTR